MVATPTEQGGFEALRVVVEKHGGRATDVAAGKLPGNLILTPGISDQVKHHQGWGLGAYCFFNVNPSIIGANGFEAPKTPGVQFHDILTVSPGGVGTIEKVINNTGGTANTANLGNRPRKLPVRPPA